MRFTQLLVHSKKHVHEYDAAERIRPELPRIGQDLKHAERPAYDHGGRRGQVLDQLADVLPATDEVVPFCRFLGSALRARVQGNHPMGGSEVSQLRLPDLGGRR